MAASTAPDYTNSRTSDSGKFARVEMIRASTLAERHRNLLVAMLHKNRFGDELWMSTESICVVMGRVCYRRKIGETDSRGRKLGSCEQISRRAVQRLIDELAYCRQCNKPTSDHPADHAFVPRVEGGGVLDAIYEANSLVPYGGGKKFRHTATYRLNPDKLAPRKTHDEYAEERDRARARNRQAHRQESHREESQREQSAPTPIRKPAQPAPPPHQPAPAAPLPREQPAAEKHEHRSTDRAPRQLTSREGPKLVNEMRRLMRGASSFVEAHSGLEVNLPPDDPRYRAPMSQENALIAACMNLALPEKSAREFLKLLPRDVGESDAEQGP